MALWTDVIDPATLTGYTRAALAGYEVQKGTLAQWLPNRVTPSINVKFAKGGSGLVEIAEFRAYDAEPTIGDTEPVKTVTLELPALGRNFPVSEYNQLRANGAVPSDAAILQTIQKTAVVAARAAADAIEYLRGVVLQTGKATVSNFMDDDFGRAGGHTTAAGTKWDAGSGVTVLKNIQAWVDTMVTANGVAPGAIITSTKVARAMAASAEFANQLINGTSRPATLDDVNGVLVGAGLPPIYLYDRNVKKGGAATKVISDKFVILAPAPVEPDDFLGTELGGTFWGRTLASQDAGWNIPEEDQPGLVVGVYRNEKPPMIAEVISDAIAMPVLANADLTLAAQVLT